MPSKSKSSSAAKPAAKRLSLEERTERARKLAIAASKDEGDARARFRKLTPALRKRVVGSGLAVGGTAYRLFVEEGITLKEQIESARTARVSRELQAELASKSTDRPARKRTRKSVKPDAAARSRRNHKEDQVSKQSSSRTRKQTSTRTPRKPIPAGKVSPAEIAKRAKVTPLDVRKALRSQSRIKKSDAGWALTPKQADALVAQLKG